MLRGLFWKEGIGVRTRQEAVAFCKKYAGAVEDYPFHDDNWTVMRHCGNKKIFAMIFEREGRLWLNVKCDTEWRDFWRQAYASVIPAYHMNKEHWNSIILDGTIPDSDVERMLLESYELTKPAQRKTRRSGKTREEAGRAARLRSTGRKL